MSIESALNLITSVLFSIGSASAIIFGLSSWLGKLWAKRILAKEKQAFETELIAIKDKNTAQLEDFKAKQTNLLESLKRHYSISQPTYTELFRRKLELHNNLLEIKTKYTRQVNEDYNMIIHDYPAWPYHNLFSEIRKPIEENRLLISNELSLKYDSLYMKIVDRIMAIKEHKAELSTYNQNNREKQDFIDWAMDREDELERKMRDETYSEMSELLKQIDLDATDIRKILDNSMRA